jgi:3-dehydroquinate synthetase
MEGDMEIVPGGERAKNNWNLTKHIMNILADGHLCRHSHVLAIGGGSFLDIVGLAASLVHRGVRLLRAPSTVLAQNEFPENLRKRNLVESIAEEYAWVLERVQSL